MLDTLEDLIERQRAAGRKIANYAKRRRKNSHRLDGLHEFFEYVPPDLCELYERYDGAEAPQTMWKEHSYFFGHFLWYAADSIMQSNKNWQTREEQPLLDEIFFSHGLKVQSLLITPSRDRKRYVMTVSETSRSDVRYVAFDSLPSMLNTYLAALKTGAWRFDDQAVSIFDNEAFLKVAADNNENTDYWTAIAEDTVDFDIRSLELGKRRPRTEKLEGYKMLEARGIQI